MATCKIENLPRPVICPLCLLTVSAFTKHECSQQVAKPVSRGGRPRTERCLRAAEYASELGISSRTLLMLGGPDRLQSMSEDARAVMVNDAKARSERNRLAGAA